MLFDEFHERSIHADIAMALARESQQVLRNDLRILVMSATLDVAALKGVLGYRKAITNSINKRSMDRIKVHT